MNKIPKPIARTKDTVTLSSADWKFIIDRFDDASDRAALRNSLTSTVRGEDNALPLQLYRRIRKGENPVHVWREHRGLGLNALARKAGMSASYLSEIESGSKPGSAKTLKKLANALGTDVDELI
ncbi:MAG: helix-turn-helix transcriptional regulator [Proteobacteria bacterium]|nr:helix-turn-helix transcriptional regulator [Pseudomonadota bacterium]